tara:strand:- start:71 stop:466 length:396 start_codon:yes stop_codon:yes gene_type:complete
MVFEGGSVVKEYVGGYDDWLDQRPDETKPGMTSSRKRIIPSVRAPKARIKLGFSEQRELDTLPFTIECLERDQQELFGTMADPELYKKDRSDLAAANERLEELKRLLAEAYARWEELEQLQLDADNNRLLK